MPADADNPPARPSFLRRTWRVLVLSVSSMAIVAALVALVMAYKPMNERAEEIVTGRLRVRFLDWPKWLDDMSQAELTELAERSLTNEQFDHDALVRTQEALMATGWFAEPVTVARAPGGTVNIVTKHHGEDCWRLPAAVVRWQGKDYLIAEHAERLIREYEPDTSGLPVIVGTQFDAPAAFGSVWLGGDVEAGLALLQFLKDSRVWDQVAGVDVSTYTQDKQLIIITDRGSRIMWGGPPGDFTPGQPSGEIRRRRLEKIQTDSGHIDANRQVSDIRLMENVYEVISPQEKPPVEEPKKN